MAAPSKVGFLGIARIGDKAVLAKTFDKSALPEEKTGFESTLTAVLQGMGSVFPGWRDQRKCEAGGNLYVMADTKAIFIAVAGIRDTTYPDRVVLQLLRELAEMVRQNQGDEAISVSKAGTLSASLKKSFRELMRKYEDAASQDKTTEVREKVDQLKGVMQDNVKRILETHVTLDTLNNNSQSMSSQANQFLKQSVDLKRQVQLRNLKLKLIVGLCALAVILYFVVLVYN
mmetsp:Transcript_23776/g.55391  ORF Transcript_23776/g.55391 Transcript_23776/m.55391 type:complete len:230 (+) Transcript_23776:106-795(+)|eukprot:CAMPEP_0178432432 /NCGR_PEP_ID=MMETSP0689_2-20121128/32377_1 /TAXON_ID=160604 /ORGANISM="Amphidinium massartii, Strain CS-259" /LENGTH=229 /DNA_ID=CAMNT_0020054409 /DNA_START=22 /DNA_END=711 /DNA_ORIENTATION=+